MEKKWRRKNGVWNRSLKNETPSSVLASSSMSCCVLLARKRRIVHSEACSVDAVFFAYKSRAAPPRGGVDRKSRALQISLSPGAHFQWHYLWEPWVAALRKQSPQAAKRTVIAMQISLSPWAHLQSHYVWAPRVAALRKRGGQSCESHEAFFR